MSPRPPLPVGAYGDITVTEVTPSRWRARARFRGIDGVTRQVERIGQTKGQARQRLRAALTADSDVSPTSVTHLAQAWLTEIDASDRAHNTKHGYRFAVERHILPRVGAWRISEVTPRICDRTLRGIADAHGPSTAKTAKTVLAGMFGLAVRHDMIPANPVRESAAIAVPRPVPRALTAVEVDAITDGLRTDPRAVMLDLPDLVDFGLATGCRIGEALALRDAACDLDAGTVEINATVIRVKGEGLIIQERPKTAAGWRVLALPGYAVEMLRRRAVEERFRAPEGTVFASPLRPTLRDPSNCAGDLREALDRLGYGWVHFHTFRKTVATMLDDAGWSARQVADQLGHSNPSMTNDRYMGRRVVSSDAARVLDR